MIQVLMDDLSDFLSNHFSNLEEATESTEKGCASTLKSFIDYIAVRETENFRSRRNENENSVTLTTIHQVILFLCIRLYLFCTYFSLLKQGWRFYCVLLQSKGLEWDVVFIVKVCFLSFFFLCKNRFIIHLIVILTEFIF